MYVFLLPRLVIHFAFACAKASAPPRGLTHWHIFTCRTIHCIYFASFNLSFVPSIPKNWRIIYNNQLYIDHKSTGFYRVWLLPEMGIAPWRSPVPALAVRVSSIKLLYVGLCWFGCSDSVLCLDKHPELRPPDGYASLYWLNWYCQYSSFNT